MSDKRSVATDALEVLGDTIPPNKEVGRDAIHLATFTAKAGHTMLPGQQVGLLNGEASIYADKMIGIADPFITRPIKHGEKFLVVIFPRKIASLRHVWSHPDIPDEITATTSTVSNPMEELGEIAKEIDREMTAEVLLDGMDSGRVYDGDRFQDYGVVNIPPRAWDLYEKIKGKRSRHENEEVYFSCSC